MKYETPELTALTPAINAVQGTGVKKLVGVYDGAPGVFNREISVGYEDWE